MRTSQNAHGTLPGLRPAFRSTDSLCVGVLSSACHLRARLCPLASSSPRQSSSRGGPLKSGKKELARNPCAKPTIINYPASGVGRSAERRFSGHSSANQDGQCSKSHLIMVHCTIIKCDGSPHCTTTSATVRLASCYIVPSCSHLIMMTV